MVWVLPRPSYGRLLVPRIYIYYHLSRLRVKTLFIMSSISPVALFLIIVLAFVIASSAGAKRRIGFGWSLFFCLGGVLPGLIATYLSPLLKGLKQPQKKTRKIFIIKYWAFSLG